MSVHSHQSIMLNVVRRQPETAGYQSVFFERPVNFSFESGDWIDLQFPGLHLDGGITYSIAASPTEDCLRITFREGLSQFKKKLAAVQPGDLLQITQYGNDYGFTLRGAHTNVLIAGGVGVAPFRSMIKEMYDTGIASPTRLVYLNKTDEFLFQEELALWQAKITDLTVDYLNTTTLKRKHREKALKTIITDNRQKFYIAGPPAMVESTRAFLIEQGVQSRAIKLDIFGGY